MWLSRTLARGIIFRQLQCPQSNTFTYVLGCAQTKEALLIDPVLENFDRDVSLLEELQLDLKATVDSHVHADHISGASAHRLRGSQVLMPKKAGAAGTDRLLEEGDVIKIGKIELNCLETPGHTAGCMSFHVPAVPCVFTGDALLIRGCGRTDFQSGSASQLYDSIKRILSFSDETLLFVGHDYRGLMTTTVREERNFNPRIAGEVSKEDFVGYMKNLNLPHPKLMAEAVPANMECGRLQAKEISPRRRPPGWGDASLRRTLTGHFEISSGDLEELLGRVCVVDVREPHEMSVGRIPGAVSMPLASLPMQQLASEKRPIVFVCRAGARSAQACVLLSKAFAGEFQLRKLEERYAKLDKRRESFGLKA